MACLYPFAAIMQSGLTEAKEHSPHVRLEAECFEGMSVYR